MEIAFWREIGQDDRITLLWSNGADGLHSKGTKVSIELSEGDEARNFAGWKLERCHFNGKRTAVTLSAPPDCPVGAWECCVRCHTKDGEDEYDSESPVHEIFMLFNPWAEGEH